jgi:Family of unknown function (DUF5706)
MTLDNQDAIKEARDQLNLVLSFFARVDAKASVVLAVNTGMLAVLASNAPAARNLSISAAIAAALAALLIAVSLWFLYKVAFPALNGGHQSLVFFREIARRTEARFIEEFIAQDKASRLKDLLGQVWRNSEILKLKFDALRFAFILMAIAIIPWVVAVALLSAQHGAAGPLILR